MSCKCKNIIENFLGGDIPLTTTFLSPVYFSANTYTSGSIFSGGTNLLDIFCTSPCGSTFTGNTSASCITDLYITNLYGCSPITVHDNIQHISSSAIGINSIAWGSGTTASGNYSHAEGHGTFATGYGSHAEGGISVDKFGVLEPRPTSATTYSSHAEGTNTLASGISSHAEGDSTIASSGFSHAEGAETTASGEISHAEGYATEAIGQASHSEGTNTFATGVSSHAEGEYTLASGAQSHAEGSGTVASGDYSHAEGDGTFASGDGSHAEGGWWDDRGTPARSPTSATTLSAHAEGAGTLASGFNSHAEGLNNIASGIASHAEGGITRTSIGGYYISGTEASSYSSHAEGVGTLADGFVSHAEGTDTRAKGTSSHAEGTNTLASGYSSHAEGDGTIASGSHSHSGGKSGLQAGIIASGKTSFVHFEQTTPDCIFNGLTGSTCDGITGFTPSIIGAFGDNSAILGGTDHNIGTGSTSSGIFGGSLNTINNDVTRSVILGGENNIIYHHPLVSGVKNIAMLGGSNLSAYTAGDNNVLIGGENNSFPAGAWSPVARSVILGGSGIIGRRSDTVYVPSLNIVTPDTSSMQYNLGIDTSGFVVTGTTGGGGGTFTGNTSADCITNLWVTNISGCSPVTIGTPAVFNSTATVKGDVLIKGNVTILGTATTINSETVLIKDNILTLNSNATGTTAPFTLDSGIDILRNSATTACLLWEETNDYWAAGLCGFTRQIILEGDSLSLLVSGHTHPIGEIIGLQSALDTKVSGATNLASTGIFAQKTGQNLEFKGITSTGTTVTITNDSTTVNLEVTIPPGTNTYVSGGTFSGTTLYLDRTDGQQVVITGFTTASSGGVSGGTFSGTTLYLDRTDGQQVVITGFTASSGGGGSFTGNTSSTCINELWVSTISGCSPVTIGSEVYVDGPLTITASGNTQPVFNVLGSSGQLFSINDSLIGELFSVNDISGIPILSVNSDDTILMGNFDAPSLNTTVKSLVNIGSTTIYSVPTSAYTSAYFDYNIVGNGSARAGNVMAIWSGSTVNYSETSTTDIGNTSPVTLSVVLSGGTASFNASATTNNWVMKTIVRSI